MKTAQSRTAPLKKKSRAEACCAWMRECRGRRMRWSGRPTALVEILYRSAPSLDLAALLFVLEAPLLRRTRRFRRATHLRLDPRFFDHCGQAFHRVAPVVFLRAMALCGDDDHVLVREASTC